MQDGARFLFGWLAGRDGDGAEVEDDIRDFGGREALAPSGHGGRTLQGFAAEIVPAQAGAHSLAGSAPPGGQDRVSAGGSSGR